MSRVDNGNRNQIEVLIRHDQMQDELLTEFCSRRNLPPARACHTGAT